MLITDKQVNIDLFPHGKEFHFQHEEQDCVLPSKDKIREFFQKQSFDTVKLCHEGKRGYVHFGLDDVEVFDSKWALRNALSYENGGAWVEEKEGRKRYFVDDSGWFNTSYKRVSKEEFLQRLESPSTMQKALSIGLGILALLPGALEIKERLPFGASEAGVGLLALQQKSPLLGALGYSFLPNSINAQAVGTEFQVNNYTTNNQLRPAIAALNDGGFVVAWESLGQDGDLNGIFGQRYDRSGRTVDAEFQVNNFTTSHQENPAIAPLNDGGFVVAWQSLGQDGDFDGIFAQRYDNAGALPGPEFQINNFTTNYQRAPAIAPLNDGGFVVAWQSDGQDGDLYGIFAQRYDANGALLGSEFQVNNFTTSRQESPEIAPLNDGGFVVAWQSDDHDGDSYGIFAQRYDASGALFGSEFQVNNYTTSYQGSPAVAPLNDGGFVLAWQSDGQDGGSSGVFAQRYGANGALYSLEFQVNNYAISSQQLPAVAPLNDGGFVLAWQSDGQDGDGAGIFAQRYLATGALLGSEFQVNNYTASNQQSPAIGPLNDGGFVLAWQSNGQDGSGDGIFAQRYDRGGNPVQLTYVPSMSSASAISSNAGTTRSTTSANNVLSSNSVSNVPTSSITTPLTSNAPTSPSSEFVIPADVDIIYGEIYSIRQGGQVIGTYTISGGSGQLDGTIPNVLTVQLDPNYVPEEGDTLTLFSFAEGQGSFSDNLIVEGFDSECLEARPESSGNGLEFQIIFEEASSCTTIAPELIASAFPILIN